MSDLRVALVVEGATDQVIIEAALKAFLPRPFVLTRLQPEATQPKMGEGWTGVLKWCEASGRRHVGSLDVDPSLAGYDLLIIHLDLDVASTQYACAGQAVEALALQRRWAPLPCALPWPPVGPTARALELALASWMAPAQIGEKTILCLPAQASGTWLAAAYLPPQDPRLAQPECNLALEGELARLPLALRTRKSVRDYRSRSESITTHWQNVKALCSQAAAFEAAVIAALPEPS